MSLSRLASSAAPRGASASTAALLGRALLRRHQPGCAWPCCAGVYRQLSVLSLSRRPGALSALSAAPLPQFRPFSSASSSSSSNNTDSSNSKADPGAPPEPEDVPADGEPDTAQLEKHGLLIILAALGLIGGGVYWYTRPEPEELPEEEEEQQDKKQGFWEWMKGMFLGASPLLPPETPDINGRRPRTVVLSFDKTIVYCEWHRSTGWQIRKRPGVDRFLERLHLAGYEIVLWSNMPSYEVETCLAELDSQGYIKHKLYNDHTNWQRGGKEASWWQPWRLVKDLNRLQRDPKRLIVIDTSNERYAAIGEHENVLLVPPFVDDANDRMLYKLTAMLENVKRYNLHDVTSVIHRWNQNPDEDLFAREKAAALEASKNLREAAAGGRGPKDGAGKKEQQEEKAAAAQSWGSWIKQKIVGAAPATPVVPPTPATSTVVKA